MWSMPSLVDLSSLGALLGRPHEHPVSARRFRSAAVTVHTLGPESPWQWQCVQPQGDELAMFASAQSPVQLSISGRMTQASAGFFMHPLRTSEVVADHPTSVLCAWVPWSSLQELDVGGLDCLAIDTPTPLLGGFRAFAGSLVSQGSPSTMYTDYLVERLLVEMAFGTVLEASAGGAAGTRGATAREQRPIDRARSLMLLRRSDASFGVEELARELHLSTRQLQRVFATYDATPADELRRLRVELAQELLSDPTYAPLSLTEIAAHSGFNTPAALRRAFASQGLPLPTSRSVGR